MVATPSQTDTYSTALDIFDRTHPLRVDADENLKVTGTLVTVPGGNQDVTITNWPTLQQVAGTVTLSATPTIDIGAVSIIPSTDAVGSIVRISPAKTALLGTNAGRKGLIIQIGSVPVYIWLGSTAVPTYSLGIGSILEIENFVGAVFGSVDSGSTSVSITEKI
jgi:hypothetical protein